MQQQIVRNRFKIPAILALFFVSSLYLPIQLLAQPSLQWVEESNQHTQLLLEVQAKNSPESAARLGLEGYDEKISDLTPGFKERSLERLETAQIILESRLEEANEGPVKQDLQILLLDIARNLEGNQLEEEHLLPFYDVARLVYFGLRSLLEDRISPERRQAAIVRLKKYVGSEPGTLPITILARQFMQDEWKNSNRLAPFREEVERSLSTSVNYLEEIGTLFLQYEIKSFEEDYHKLKKQIEAYNDFVRTEVLPNTRDEFRLPPEIYAFQLKEYGIDMPVEQLSRRASVAFEELQAQMQLLANHIAEKHGFPSNDYRDVLRSLKKEQLDSASILPFYQQKIREIEEIIKMEEIVTLPDRDMVIRLATKAESAATPSPFMSPPRLIGNTGEYGEFVLPVRVAGGSDGSSMLVDDFLHKAASWALTAHEGRPGHELQYTSIVERGVSQARVIFAMNSVNVEGWALYMEEQMLPYVPLEGQFMILWSRLVRAGRAFLDPGLNMGTITTEEASYVLRNEIVLSEALVRSELERYRFRAPGQAASYFNGYVRLMELRAETELLLGLRFNKKAFHDFILSQGLLPPAIIRQVVLRDFIPLYQESGS